MIYLDNAATTLHKPESVYEAVEQAMRTCASLGRSGHDPARKAAETAFLCRSAAADFFELPAERVVFTLNTTHALNIAIKTLVRPGDHVVISGFEHNAVLRTLYALNAEICVAGKRLFDPEDTIQAFESALAGEPSAVVCTHISNVFGYVLPIEEIAAICRRRHIPLIVDAAQSAGVRLVSLKDLGADFVAAPGHKSLYGPQGTGLLLCGENPTPLLHGGTGSSSRDPKMPEFLPDRAEAGTQNIPGVAGLMAGIQFVNAYGLSEIRKHEKHLVEVLRERLARIPEITPFFGASETQSGVVSFTQNRLDCEFFAQRLSETGIAVRSGLHCSPLAHASAGTLDKGTVRLSVSVFNTVEEIEEACDHIRHVIRS